MYGTCEPFASIANAGPGKNRDFYYFGNCHKSHRYGHPAPGFTLVELMIVIAIIGILAAIAVPSYYGYVARAQFSEGLSLTSGLKTEVANAYQAGHQLTGIDNGTGSIPPAADISGTYVSSVVVADGIITARFSGDSALADETMTLRPIPSGNALTWRCTTTAGFTKAPASCRTKTPDVPDSDEIPVDDGQP